MSLTRINTHIVMTPLFFNCHLLSTFFSLTLYNYYCWYCTVVFCCWSNKDRTYCSKKKQDKTFNRSHRSTKVTGVKKSAQTFKSQNIIAAKAWFTYLWTELAFDPVKVIVQVTSFHQVTAPSCQLSDDSCRLTKNNSYCCAGIQET